MTMSKEEWLPIDTAPMDRTAVLIADDDIVGEGYYHDEEKRWYWANTSPGDYPDPHQPFPTSWQPMPKPPHQGGLKP
jgi:hypothetical protein